MIFFQLYLSATLVLFFLGPWNWDVKSTPLLLGYLIAAQTAIIVGYMTAWGSTKRIYLDSQTKLADSSPGVKFLKVSLFVTFLLLIPTSLARTGSFLPDIFTGITNTGSAYNANFERLEHGNSFVVFEYVRMLAAPFLLAVFPLTVVYWSKLTGYLKLLAFTAIFFNLSLYIATGTNKGFADLVITLPWLIYLGTKTGQLKTKFSRPLIGISIIALFFLFLQFFGMSQSKREGGVGELGVFNTGLEILTADKGHLVSAFLSDNQRIIFESLARYVSQGYYALSLSFEVDTSSTFGFGNSMFLARNADVLFGTNYFSSGSIPGVLEEQTGWGMFTLWHSIYPWLASDFGYLGTLFVLGLFGYLLGISWGKSLFTLDPLWIAMTYLLIILFFYIPANNQIFQSGETCVGFFLIFIFIFLRSRMRFFVNKKHPQLNTVSLHKSSTAGSSNIHRG